MVSTILVREDESIVLPNKKLTRTTKGRYAIYLPVGLNELWQRLHENNVRVTVTIQINPTQPNSPRGRPGTGLWFTIRGAPPQAVRAPRMRVVVNGFPVIAVRLRGFWNGQGRGQEHN